MQYFPFHMAFPVKDLISTKDFYGTVLQCKQGREAPNWVDYDFFGHQLSAHLNPEACVQLGKSLVDGKEVPLRHFGAVLTWERWEQLAKRIKEHGISFILEPQIRYTGQPGEQGTFFIQDPSGNALEFKAFKNHEAIFI